MAIDRFTLAGKVAVVTGASKGIGKAIALGFAGAGADLAICSRKEENLEPVAAEIERLGRRAFAAVADVSKRDDIERFVSDTLGKFGRIDILVNNVARNIMSPIMNLREDGWDKIISTNLKSYFLFCQAVGQVMMGQGSGVIINMSSTAGQKAAPLLGAYSISKAGVDMLTKVLARELAGIGVRVNAISPGMVETSFSQAIWSSPEMYGEVIRDIPLGRLATTEEIVGLAIFLASDASSYVTGSIVNIDGGAMT
ncbi:MAG: SDR family oxidoreductase [Candidatus Abyssobacteria bacterium SURF_5]|uniref:SDR family oxidoreductase n=1 Tax=Abyssobacteria bacterium (strain SURF_5) TaxID=2093360 RepID=A0A3A4NCE7_ABYX5|nr:MAG: SDR family oxidoreductase [Candidatus Abyssubacteria bacterium SURF_5]